jgi:small-conductance mechanosensitive channel
VPVHLSNILTALLTLLIARLIVWVVTQIILYNYYKREKINLGSQFAINQLLKYVIYVIAILIAITNLGVNPTLIWGGLAALLVGIGLGLQQTFNDFFSGIILLFERSVEIGDVLEVSGGTVGTVKRIGMRASLIETRANITIVVPNSKLVTEDVINWSHFDNKVRFNITVSVAYGSDTKMVRAILLEVAQENSYIIEYPAPFVRFTDFGDSGLYFELHFWSRNFIIIEDIKSDLRFNIDAAFREAGITIPFPQRDVWIRSSEKK